MMHFVSALAFGVLLAFAEFRPFQAVGNFSDVDELSSKDGTEKWGYVHVREKAHMFYWFYYTTHPDGYKNRPWIIWLQGGPGASSCGLGNFKIIGPLDTDLKPRNTTWVKQVSVLFIDAPVGAGFSYVDDPSAFNTEYSHVVDDLMEVLRAFLNRTPIFETRPLYIFGQSHGGRVASFLARRLYDDIRNGSIKADLAGFAMGNAWISPVDSMINYGEFAYWMSLVDKNGRDWIRKKAEEMQGSITDGNFAQSVRRNWLTQGALAQSSNWVNIYDISKFFGMRSPKTTSIWVTMRNQKKTKLHIVPSNLSWSAQQDRCFDNLASLYMTSSIGIIDDLLRTTDLQVIIYQGQLDMICNTKGTYDWVQKLTWNNLTAFNKAEYKVLLDPADNHTDSYVKAYGKFKFYNILGAGHMVPMDKGEVAFRMLDRILNNMDQ